MIESRTFHCPALGRPHPYSVHIPPQPPPPGGWPLVLLLHGAGRSHRTIADNAETAALIEAAPFVTVFPEGALSFYIDSPVPGQSPFQSMLLELLAHARATLPVTSAPASTAICGWSMGGFGAVRFTQDHPNEVSTVASIIGLLDYPNPDIPPESNYPLPPAFGSDPAFLQSLNCCHHAPRLRGHSIAIFAATEAFDYQMNQNFSAALNRHAIAHLYHTVPGTHTWPAVANLFGPLMDFLSKTLAPPTGERQQPRAN